MAAGGGLALAASLLFARRMAAPIIRLREATGRIARGDLELRLQVSTGDEIEQLADDFNQMTLNLRESYAGLEAKVASRTTELSQARDHLQTQAREMETLNEQLIGRLQELALRKEDAERANSAKTRFLAAASHDLRQPMHSIGLLIGVLHDRLATSDLANLTNKVQHSVALMENLFSSLLDISKLDAGAVHSQLESFQILSLLRHVGDVYGPQAAATGIELRVRSCHAVVRSDSILLERILGNLVSNALRYTHSGRVLVGCRRRGAHLAIQVLDTGPGIPAGHLDDIFEEFFRLERPGAGGGGGPGLGLGLSIVKRSAALLGHPLTVRSHLGRGSVFELVIPLSPGLPTAVPDLASSTADATALAGAFVLIVDDNEENRYALEATCNRWGVHSVAACSADDAVAQLAHHLRTPELIISDFRLDNGEDGFAVIERVRGLTDENTPTIVLTAEAGTVLLKRANAVGAVVLSKPATAARLLRTAIDLLAARGTAS
jgi:signal transduction histidine kinase/CheY-like chemotaxis protein